MVRCKWCRTYVEKETAIPVGLSFFCSDDHLGQWRQKVRAPKSRLRKRASDRQTTKDISPATRQAVYESDLHRCRFCGTEFVLALHHVMYRSEGGDHQPHNLITLCAEHHNLIHSDKGRYQPLCLGVVFLREVHSDHFILIPELEHTLQNDSITLSGERR